MLMVSQVLLLYYWFLRMIALNFETDLDKFSEFSTRCIQIIFFFLLGFGGGGDASESCGYILLSFVSL